MKKVFCSVWLKFVAVILFLASIVCGVLIASDGIAAYFGEEEDIYSFESDFSESWYIAHLLKDPEGVIVNAYYDVLRDQAGNGKRPVFDLEKDLDAVEDSIKQGFEGYYYSDKVDYYLAWNDLVLTNCGAESAETLMRGDYYSYYERDEAGRVKRKSAAVEGHYGYWIEEIEDFDTVSPITFVCSIKNEVVNECKEIWERQEGIVLDTLARVLVCIGVALILFIYLICVCGKNRNGEYKNLWIDNLWLEVHLILTAGVLLGGIAVCVLSFTQYMRGHFPPHLLYALLITVPAAVGMLVLTSVCSVVRNIKTKRLVQSSLILRALRWGGKLLGRAIKRFGRIIKSVWAALFALLSKKTGVILITMLFVYTALIGLLGIGTVFSPVWLFVGILLFGFACFVVAYRAKDLDEIKKGISEVRGGNVAYKIPVLRCEDLKLLATDANDIAKGLDESVAAKVKAERLKTELITNVSHDLKTPITSIISYTELLEKTESLPEEARDYVAVIAKKSDRLKQLIQDLFDISKAQSGNDEVFLEKLDAALLIQQSLGEHDSEIQNSGLPFCVDVQKDICFYADGRKMSRVIGNLIDNILKYTMKNTRVFITASETDGCVELVFKNISAYPLDFNADEITQRFVRGDKSRSAEGNGLGLAIAKSYTEICGGSFAIETDGDLFKVILKFLQRGV